MIRLNNDIPTGVIKHFCSSMLTPEELFNNCSMIFGYYLQEGYIKQFIDYLIIREIEECYRQPQNIFRRNSTYMRILRVFLENELKPFLKQCTDVVTSTLEDYKSKLVIGNEGDPGVEKSLDKMKDILYKLMELFVTSSFSDAFLYFMSSALHLLHARTPNVETSAVRGLLFVRIIGNAILATSEGKTEAESESIKTISVVLQWFGEGDFNEQQNAHNWKAKLKEFAEAKRKSVDERITQFKNIESESLDVDLKWVNKEKAHDLLPRMQVEWRNVHQFVSSESIVLLQLLFATDAEALHVYNRMVSQLENLSVKTKQEKFNLLLTMTSMRMEIMDLQEEIRYLRETLASKDPKLAYLKDYNDENKFH